MTSSSTTRNSAASQRGKLAIAFIFAVALAMAVFAWYYQYQHSRRSMALWGEEAAVLIRRASRVELLDLEKEPAPLESSTSNDLTSNNRLSIDGQRYQITHRTDISKAPGLIHARYALMVDGNFDWDKAAVSDSPQWRVALRFQGKADFATLVFDFQSGRIRLIDPRRQIAFTPAINEAMQEYLREIRGDLNRDDLNRESPDEKLE